MTRIDFAPLLMGVDTLEVALETLQRHGAGGHVSNRLSTSMISMFALVVKHFGKVLGRRLSSCQASVDEAGESGYEGAFRNAVGLGLLSAETCGRWLEYGELSKDIATLGGREFVETALGTFPRFIEDARELVGVMADRRESEEELSDRFRCRVERMLQDGSPYD